MAATLLTIDDLHIRFHRDGTVFHPVRGVSLQVEPCEWVAVVGESGCGKSLSSLAIARLSPTDRAEVTGKIVLDGIDVSQGDSKTLAQIRGRRVAYVFQDPAGSLNPVMRVGDQIAECLRELPATARRARVMDLLDKVGFTDPARQMRAYPCEMSGGMQQRVVLAVALAGRPRLLVADEPTTALDVVTQRGVLDLMGKLALSDGLAVLLITHNLALAAGRARRVYVMYGGQVVESGPAAAVLAEPNHPYTQGLLAAVPRLEDPPGHPLQDIPGVVPAADAWPVGCAFAPRCPHAVSRCHRDAPPVILLPGGRTCRCWLCADGDRYLAAAAALHRAMGFRVLNAGKSKYYDAALKNFKHARALYIKAGMDSEWQATVARARSEHGRKYGFMGDFERLVTGTLRAEPTFDERVSARLKSIRRKHGG